MRNPAVGIHIAAEPLPAGAAAHGFAADHAGEALAELIDAVRRGFGLAGVDDPRSTTPTDSWGNAASSQA
ncbi:hypothetical protein MA6G0728R_5366 [Mycobacteroides abscessus 6G-0728-R]|nr:hypothetical protein MA6G0125S_5396 [Mycobacteroides abscessus 6G-0125-S]EIU64221.1 hypothetical protein MA6G0728S_5338 [Mycobacteroides abscessus 6G-0728-S]EIU74751.1 hypothetical protein MA6G1108_5399 [Mycobacteroides abscessus 6G-1108]EIV03086.1 hypothetical protein MA6G0728R_5366 [Mycobacteroides abscessus 6G-0728-R]